MKNILTVSLAVLLLTIGALPAFAEGEIPPSITITEEEKKEAKPAGEAITIEMMKEEEASTPWEKYLYADVDQNLNEDSQTIWTRVGTRKGNLDLSVGWTQRFNELPTEPTDKGLISFSISIWW